MSHSRDHPGEAPSWQHGLAGLIALTKSVLALLQHPLIRLAVSLLFVWLIFHNIDFNHVIRDLLGVSWMWILVAELAAAASIGVQIIVWKQLLDVNQKPLRLGKLTSLYLQGLLFSHVLPGTVCGDAFRLLKGAQLVGQGPAASSIYAGRAAELAATVATGGVALITLSGFPNLRALALVLACISLLFIYLIMFKVVLPEKMIDKIQSIAGAKAAQMLLDAADSYNEYRINRKVLICCLIGSAVGWWLLLLSLICLARAVAAPVHWNLLAVAVPLSVATATVPISFNGVGLREGVLVTMLAAYGIQAHQGLAVAILIDLQLVPLILIGVYYWLVDR
jgi:uncharacterized membrane protein YbhN (UPF0104 family)